MSRRPIEILHLVFSHYPADTRVKREAQALLGTGRRVAVIALRQTGEGPVERCGGVVAARIPGTKTRGGFVRYLFDYFVFIWRCRWLISHHRRLARVQVVHVHTLPDFLLWAALPVRRRGGRIVLDMHEIFPEFTRSRFAGPVGRMLEVAARTIERWARRRADLTITVNRPIDELLATRGIGRPERRLIVHNTADPADFGYEGRLRSDGASAAGSLRLVYHGTLTHLYGLDIAIRGVAEARGRGVPVLLSIIGDGPDRAHLSALTDRLGLREVVRFDPPVPQAALPARLTQCDGGLVPTRLDVMTQYSLSNKLLEYVHLGIPVLAARLPSYNRYLDEGSIWYWTPHDAADLARAIADFASSSPAERRSRSNRARSAMSEVAWPRERERLLAAYRELIRDG